MLIRGASGWKNYSASDVGPDRVVSMGDTVRFFWNVTFATTTTSGSACPATTDLDGDGTWTATATSFTANLGPLTGSSTPVTLNAQQNGPPNKWTLSTNEIAVTAGTAAPFTENGAQRITLSFTLTCTDPDLPGGATETNTILSKEFAIDTLRPTFATAPALAALDHDRRVRAPTASAADPDGLVGPEDVASIGTNITLTAIPAPPASEPAGYVIETRLAQIFDGAANEWAVRTAPIAFTVKDVGVDGWKEFDNPATTPKIQFRIRDVNGNEGAGFPGGSTTNTEIGFKVDNKRPNPATFSITNPQLNRRHDNGSWLMAGWNGDTSIAGVRFELNGQLLSYMDLNSDGDGNPHNDKYRAWDLAEPSNPDSTLTLRIFPVDTAGNLNMTPTIQPQVTFPRGISVVYGGFELPSQLPANIAGGDIRSLFINITNDGPDLPWDPAVAGSDKRLFGEFVRIRGGIPTFWKVGTAGSNSGTDATGHFSLTSIQDPAASPTTVFQQPPGIGHNATSGPGGVTFRSYHITNLSGRAFVDGDFELRFTIKSPTGSITTMTLPLRIDSREPDNAGNHRVYHTGAGSPNGQGTRYPGWGLGPNMTDLHGSDGNPVNVLLNLTEWRSDANGLLDSGLRNVTVELIHPANGSVVRRGNGEPARFDMNRDNCRDLLEYCVELPNTAPGGTCPTGGLFANVSIPACAWQEVVQNGRWNTTFFNATMFSGWVNLTWPDLPAGNFKFRVLAFDHAGKHTWRILNNGTAESTFYKVGPAVRVLSTAESPAVHANRTLSVGVLASQRYVTRPVDIDPSKCTSDDICPVNLVRLFVTNNKNEGLSGGVQISEQLTSAAVKAGVVETSTNGWLTRHTLDGTLEFKDGLTLRLFPYTFNQFPALPESIDITKEVYVRAEAVSTDGGSTVTAKTAWVKASSTLAPSLIIREPRVDWALNHSNQFGAPGQPIGPLYNVTFDRKIEAAAPVLTYWLNRTAGTNVADVPVRMNASEAPQLVAGAVPRFVSNWSGRLMDGSGAELPPGEYRFTVQIHDAGLVLATTERFFAIMPAAPTLDIRESELAVGVSKKGSTFFVAPSFEVPFRVNHSFANLTDPSQVKISLVRGIVRAGQQPEITPGQEGFAVQLRAGTLDRTFSESEFVALVTMPTGILNNDPFTLKIVAEVDVEPWHAGNATGLLSLVLDNQPPAGALNSVQSESTVFLHGSNPPRNRVSTDTPPFKPAFVGFTEDLGAGVGKVAVRVYDTNISRTIRFTDSGAGAVLVPGLSEDWIEATGAGPVLVLAAEDGGRRAWHIQLTGRTGIDDLWKPGDAAPGAGNAGVINLSHTYRVDVRVTDRLGQVSIINTTMFDFDAAPPTLGFGTRLGVPNGVKSGIYADTTVVPWHVGTSTPLTVNVTDNHCLAAVRLLGVSDLRPNVTVSVNMSPVDAPDVTRVCYDTMPSRPGGTNFVQYRINLADHPQLTDDVGNYTYWWEAVDMAGQRSEIPQNFRTFRMRVVDNAPATVTRVTMDPNPGQVGGRALIRADVFDNLQVSHVTIQLRDFDGRVLANGTMRPEDVDNITGSGRYVVDTQADLNVTLALQDYVVNVTAHDVNWNRSAADGGPTCPLGFCSGWLGIYTVRDDDAPAVVLESPPDRTTVNATPTITFRAQSRNLAQSGISVVAGADGSQATVPASALNFTELTAANGTRQGWTVRYQPAALPDGANFTVNVTARVGGLVNATSYRFTVDALPPVVSANVTGAVTLSNKTWAVTGTRVVLAASDNVSAATIRYKIGTAAEQTYGGEITPGGNDGVWTIEYWAVDAAGNAAARQTLSLNLDKTGPRITVSKHGDDVLLAVDDDGVGLNESSVTVHYRYGAALSFTAKRADEVGDNSFRAILPGNSTETGLAYYFTAKDLLGTDGSGYSVSQPYVIRAADDEEPGPGPGPDPEPNLPPRLVINRPIPGEQVRGGVELRWTATDPEGAPLTITIAQRDPAPGRVILPGGENTGSFRVNLTGQPAGAYTFVVTASDGNQSTTAQVTVTLEPHAEDIVIVDPLPGEAEPGRAVTFGLSIEPAGKTVLQARYRVIKDGQPVHTAPLTGTGNNFAASFTPQESGSYRVLVDVQYSDGSTTTSKEVGEFTIAAVENGHNPRVLPGSLIALLAVSVVTIALAAYGAFGRWKK